MGVVYRLATPEEVSGPIARGRFRVFYDEPGNPGSLVGIRGLSAEESAAKCMWDLRRDPRGIHMVVEVDGQIVGAMRALQLNEDDDRVHWKLAELAAKGVKVPQELSQIAELGRLYILPEHRRGGLARGLQEAMRQHLRQHSGVKLVVGAVASTNTPSATLVETLGRACYATDHNDDSNTTFVFRYELLG